MILPQVINQSCAASCRFQVERLTGHINQVAFRLGSRGPNRLLTRSTMFFNTRSGPFWRLTGAFPSGSFSTSFRNSRCGDGSDERSIDSRSTPTVKAGLMTTGSVLPGEQVLQMRQRTPLLVVPQRLAVFVREQMYRELRLCQRCPDLRLGFYGSLVGQMNPSARPAGRVRSNSCRSL